LIISGGNLKNISLEQTKNNYNNINHHMNFSIKTVLCFLIFFSGCKIPDSNSLSDSNNIHNDSLLDSFIDSDYYENTDNSDGNTDNDSGDSGDSGNSGNSSAEECTFNEKETCNYQGLPGTNGVGPCKAAIRTCGSDGKWGPCEGEVIPEYEIGELCNDGIDNDCDGKADNGQDFDGDGSPNCEDCCESDADCPDPASAWDKNIHFCSYDESDNAKLYECDDNLSPDTKEPMDYAKAIGLCKTTPNDPSGGWGVLSAEILKPDGELGASLDSNGLLNSLGSLIVPKVGGYMLALTTGKATNPFPNTHTTHDVTSDPPADWYTANGNTYPSSPACGSRPGTTGNTKDPVMFKLRIRVPMAAKSFMFNLYFLSTEYIQYVCSNFNDFFITLLDSTHTSEDPELQNPLDKNLAMDEYGNPVGVNLAPAGLFKQCKNGTSDYEAVITTCVGTDELQETGFDNHGGTGWLVTRGNVVPGEVITLRLAIWDLGDYVLDSMVLIDNFRWEFEEYKPGTEEK